MWLLKIVIATIFDYIGYIGNFTLQTTSVWLLVSHAKFTSIQIYHYCLAFSRGEAGQLSHWVSLIHP